MKEGSFLVGNIGSKIFATNNVPSASKFIIEFSLDDSGHFAVLLGLEDALHICYFLNGGVRDADDGALLLWLHI
jgi:hypothetical protein